MDRVSGRCGLRAGIRNAGPTSCLLYPASLKGKAREASAKPYFPHYRSVPHGRSGAPRTRLVVGEAEPPGATWSGGYCSARVSEHGLLSPSLPPAFLACPEWLIAQDRGSPAYNIWVRCDLRTEPRASVRQVPGESRRVLRSSTLQRADVCLPSQPFLYSLTLVEVDRNFLFLHFLEWILVVCLHHESCRECR